MNHKPLRRQRPVNLNLITLKFPVMAITSILHRISGVILFLLFPVMIYFLQRSLQSPEGFLQLQTDMHTLVFFKLFLWAFMSAMSYHFLAGLRHLLMDAGFGESLSSGRLSAMAVIIASVLFTLFTGIWIWFLILPA